MVEDEPAEPQTPREDESAEEAYGPLTVRRHRKDDGRELLLYSRDAQAQAPAP